MIGKTLGHYEILSHLGSGGMGDVYLAHDARLNRKVALKMLPPRTAGRPDLLSRFRREFESVAALSHPNIVTIFSVEEEDGVHFLTMELIEGRTLDQVIPAGGLPVADLLALALPISDALFAAHEAGVVHRDIKPTNIMVDRRGHVRIMDFGLAKLEARRDEQTSSAPTEVMTREGTQVGTVPYMAPEQVKGKTVDHRVDIFAFGVLLYEMACGRRPFKGETRPEIMSAILRDDPEPLTDLRPDLPRRLDPIVSRCLAKNPDERFRTAGELNAALAGLRDDLSSPSGAPRTAPSPSARRLIWSLIAAVILVSGLLLWWQGRSPSRTLPEPGPPTAPVERKVSRLTFGDEVEEWPAWSPDGTRLAYSAEVSGFRKIFIRDMATGETRQVTEGPADDVQASWSPDGRSLAFVRSSSETGKMSSDDLFGNFVTGGDIWRLDIGAGTATTLIEGAFHPAWSPDGKRLAFYAGWAGPRRIWIADERGRNPRQITTDRSEAVDHVEPAWSPDGARIVYRRREKSKSDIQVVDLVTAAVIWLTDDDYRDLNARWSPDGASIIFSSYRGGGQNLWRQPVDASGRPSRSADQLTTGAGNDVQPALSPDGGQVGFVVLGINSDLWRLALDPETGQRAGEPERVVSTSREDSRGAWSPDGTMLAFNSDRTGDMNIWLKSFRDGSERRLTSGSGGDYQPCWSPDGSRIVFFSSRAGNVDIWEVEVATGETHQLTDDPSLDEDPFYSPDGRYIAFQSDRDGRLEVWVMGADGSGQRQLGMTGTSGHFMRWTDDSSAVIHRVPGEHGTNLFSQPLDGDPGPLPALEGAGHHISYSPDRSLILDVTGHKTIWTYPTRGGERNRVFEFDDPDSRIDYPVWSPDGRWVIFDRADYQGADIWLLEGL